MVGTLRLRVEEIAASDQAAASQAAALTALVALARGFTAPLPSNAANNGLKELLKTAEVTQKRNRMVVTATLSPALFAAPGQNENSSGQPAPPSGPGASN